MINPNLLNILKSNPDDPSYSIIIQDFNQPEFCNKDELQMTIHQVNPNVFDIIAKKDEIIQTLKELLTDNNIEIPDQYDLSINNIVQKTLSVSSILNYDQASDMFTSGLTGSISAESNQTIPSQSVQGEIKNKRIIFTTKDYPNVLNSHQFIVQKNQLTINLTDDIENIEVTLNHSDLIASYNDYSVSIPFIPFKCTTITDGQVVIDIEDVRESIIPTQIINDLDATIESHNTEINTLQNSIDEDEMTEEEIAEINADIETLTNETNILINRKQAILNKIQGLNFSSTKPFEIDIKYTYHDDITNKFIECINFELTQEITIDFLNTYKSLPGLILTIDKQNKKYSSYDTVFKTNNLDEYIGVTITFNNLKRLREPIEVNAIIIGDDIVQTNAG